MPNLKTNKNSSLDNQIIRNVFCVTWPRNVYGPWHQTRKIWFLIKVKCFFLILNINISHQKFLFLNNEKMSKKKQTSPRKLICNFEAEINHLPRKHLKISFHLQFSYERYSRRFECSREKKSECVISMKTLHFSHVSHYFLSIAHLKHMKWFFSISSDTNPISSEVVFALCVSVFFFFHSTRLRFLFFSSWTIIWINVFKYIKKMWNVHDRLSCIFDFKHICKEKTRTLDFEFGWLLLSLEIQFSIAW